jgi:hypothetical protein
MKKLLVAAVTTISVLAFAGQALAAEVKGFIKNINGRDITIQTNNAGQVNAPAGIEPQTMVITVPPATGNNTDMMVGLSPGMTITVTYTSAGTGAAMKNTASKIVK